MSIIAVGNKKIRFGFHVENSKNLLASLRKYDSTPYRAFQVYLSGHRSFDHPSIDPKEALEIERHMAKTGSFLCVHGSLLYNLCGSTTGRTDLEFEFKMKRCIDKLVCEVETAASFGAGVVVHIGSCKKAAEGIELICESVEEVLSRTLQGEIFLENSAGEGTKLGKSIAELKAIYEGLSKSAKKRIRFCIDTAHAFGAGMCDFGDASQVDKFFRDFDREIGVDKIALFHLNDSKVPFGSKKDRHEDYGLGLQFSSDDPKRLNGLRRTIEMACKHNIPLVGETPGEQLFNCKVVETLMRPTKYSVYV